MPDSAASSPAARSSARESASQPDRSTAAVEAACSTRWACHSSVSTVSANIVRTRSCASSPVSCSRRGASTVNSVSHRLWKRLR
ncbi:Uncharacterised protein [Mycobacterium tuberculosis]|nr:Uncharacterised protein [Mycobacterium tuberculosis]